MKWTFKIPCAEKPGRLPLNICVNMTGTEIDQGIWLGESFVGSNKRCRPPDLSIYFFAEQMFSLITGDCDVEMIMETFHSDSIKTTITNLSST